MSPNTTPVPASPRLLRASLAAGALLTLAACGSGGGDSPPPPAPVPVQISAANQDTVARATANTVISAGTLGGVTPLATGDRVSAAGKLGIGASAAPSLGSAGSALAVVQRFGLYALATGRSGQVNAGGKVTAQAVSASSVNCAVSGSLTVNINDADNSGTLSAGDSISFAFAACKPTATETVNGSMTLAVSSASATTVGGSISFAALTASGPDGSFAINGGVSLAYSEAGTLATYQMVIAAGGLSTVVSTAQYSDTITLGGGFEQTVTYDAAALPPGSTIAGLGTARVNGTISAASLGGTVTLATVAPFRQYDIDPYPRDGQLRATGANGSALRLTALSVTTVRIELDANGDGIYEQSRDVPWGVLI